MSQTIKLKRSAVAGKVPTTSSLDLGEVAINTNDGKVFFKKDDGTQSIQTIVTTDSLTTGSINVSGSVTASSAQIASLNYPTSDGVNGQILVTDGAGNLSFSSTTGPITASVISASYIDLDVLENGDIPVHREGRIFYGAEDGALEVYNDEADITLQVGQEFWIRAFNPTDSTISNGTPVRASGSQGDRIAIYPALAEDHTTGIHFDSHIIGLATHDIEASSEGYVTAQGIVRGVDTQNFSAGDTLYLQTGSAGLRNSPPPFPYDIVQVGYASKIASNGFIFVEPKEPVHFSNISGLSGSATEPGDLWIYQSNNAWSPGKLLSGSYTIDNGDLNVIGAVTASSFTGSFSGDASELNNTRLFISGIDLDNNNIETTFSKLQFDSDTGLYVSASDADTAFVFLGSHFRDIFVDGSSTLIATGSDQLDIIASGGLDIRTSLVDTDANSVSKELIFSVDDTVVRTTGNQTITGTKTFSGNNLFSGTQTFDSITVNGTGSFGYIQSVTGSAKIIGDAFIILNTEGTGSRFAGVSVIDSGSATTASLQWDSLINKWTYINSSDVGYGGGGLISGPRLTGSQTPDDISYPTLNTITRGQGGDHIYDSNITDDDTDVTVGINLVVQGTVKSNTITLISSSAQVDHDLTSGFVSNEHINHTAVSITAGDGLSGGGTIASTRTITLNTGSAHFTDGVKKKLNTEGVLSSSAQIATEISGAFSEASSSFSTRVTQNESDITTLQGKTLFSGSIQVDHDATTNFIANEHINHTSVTLTAGDGLTGGGDISSNRSFAVDATVARTGSNAFEGNQEIDGNLGITGSISIYSSNISHQENSDVDTGTETVATLPTADFDAAFFDFVVKNSTNLRAGTVYAVHDGAGNVEFTETSTQDLGDTSGVTLIVDISGADLRLRATVNTDNWVIKTLVRGI